MLYAREGADVAISFLPRERSDALVTRRAVEAAGRRRCLLLPGDVTSRRYCDAAVKKTVKELGASTFWFPTLPTRPARKA